MTKPSSVRCRINAVTYHGWEAIELDNGIVRSVVVPDIGGRIMAFDLGPYPFLWNNRSLWGQLFTPEENAGDGTAGSWKNYGGSKTWPAPQGWNTEDQWHGPPDPVLDSGRYALRQAHVVDRWPTVIVASPVDPRTGMQITRTFALDPAGAHATLHLQMRNASSRPRTWSIWDVVQLDTSRVLPDGGEGPNERAWLYVPTNSDSAFASGYQVMFGEPDNPEWQAQVRPALLGAQYLFRIGKIGVDSQAGWLAFVNGEGDWAFCQRFAVDRMAKYPDDGATVECWTTGIGASVSGLNYTRNPLYHLEAEVLGPLRRLEPGESQSLDIEWYAARCPGPIVDVTPAGCVHEPLRTEFDGRTARLQGVFGLFYPGRLDGAWMDRSGRDIATCSLGEAHPLDVLRLDAVRVPPVEATSLELRVIDAEGACLGTLASAPVKEG